MSSVMTVSNPRQHSVLDMSLRTSLSMDSFLAVMFLHWWGCTGPGAGWLHKMKFWREHTADAGLISQPADLWPSILLLCYHYTHIPAQMLFHMNGIMNSTVPDTFPSRTLTSCVAKSVHSQPYPRCFLVLFHQNGRNPHAHLAYFSFLDFTNEILNSSLTILYPFVHYLFSLS